VSGTAFHTVVRRSPFEQEGKPLFINDRR